MQEQDNQQTDKHRRLPRRGEEQRKAPEPVVPYNLASSAPSESFGSFYTAGSSLSPDPYQVAPNPPVQFQAGHAYSSEAMPEPAPSLSSDLSDAPAVSPINSAPPLFASPLSPCASEPERESYPPLTDERSPLYFPLLRNAPPHVQLCGMIFYSLFMAICIMSICLTLTNAQQGNPSPFVSANGGSNPLNILLLILLLVLVMPACSLLSGALFGSWRGVLVSIGSVGSGIFITHLTNNRFWNNPQLATYLPLLALPVAAFIVGLIYERRKYAAWWKSVLSMLLGSAIIATWLVVLMSIANVNSPRFASASASAPNPQAVVISLLVGGLILALLGTLALTFPISIVEGLLHWRIVAEKKE